MRNSVENRINSDIKRLQSMVLTRKQAGTETNSRKDLEKMEVHLKTINQSVARVAAAAESFGVLQIECKIKKSISAIMKHIWENLRFNFEKNNRELEELRSLFKECQLLEEVEEGEEQKQRTISTSAVTLKNTLESFLETEERAINCQEQSEELPEIQELSCQLDERVSINQEESEKDEENQCTEDETAPKTDHFDLGILRNIVALTLLIASAMILFWTISM